MGILKEKVERIDSLYASYYFDEENDKFMKEGFATLSYDYDYDFLFDNGKNGVQQILGQNEFTDKNYFEDFTNKFPRDVYRI